MPKSPGRESVRLRRSCLQRGFPDRQLTCARTRVLPSVRQTPNGIFLRNYSCVGAHSAACRCACASVPCSHVHAVFRSTIHCKRPRGSRIESGANLERGESGFMNLVRFIEEIHRKWSPDTKCPNPYVQNCGSVSYPE